MQAANLTDKSTDSPEPNGDNENGCGMSSSQSAWTTLSPVDVSEHSEKKGRFTYLSWAWAWACVKDRFPLAEYTLLPDVHYADGTMEVRVEVTIHELSHTMWLAVMDYQNDAIQNPDAAAINIARMRCLVKCLAMHGLGHYIYAGEDLPPDPDGQAEPSRQYRLGQLATANTPEVFYQICRVLLYTKDMDENGPPPEFQQLFEKARGDIERALMDAEPGSKTHTGLNNITDFYA